MKKLLYPIIFFSLILFSSCNKKKVQLPLIDQQGIPEIHNHSSIWIFYELKNNDTLAILNKNNKIINTHWIFNIDKRLPMKKIAPLLQKMQADKNKESMHKKEGFFNYFSYADMASNQISLINFTPTAFVFTEQAYQDLLNGHSKNIELDIQNDALFLDKQKINMDQLVQKLNDLKINDTLNSLKISLKYPGNTSYQRYLKTKAYLNKTVIQIDSTEYIYNLK